jgi:hypothetical protein
MAVVVFLTWVVRDMNPSDAFVIGVIHGLIVGLALGVAIASAYWSERK